MNTIPLNSDSDTVASVRPVVGILGSAGAYGRWLTQFFNQTMGLTVLGYDPAASDSYSLHELAEQADVVVFSVPIRHTEAVIQAFSRLAPEHQARQLWLDITSIKAKPVAAMLQSSAEVVGLHPMAAPPKSPNFKGRVLVVCYARITRWAAWLDSFLKQLQAHCVSTQPETHDQIMTLVQAMVHAVHLAQAGVIRHFQSELGDIQALMPFRSAAFELDSAVITRMLSLNPNIYEDIQFNNPYVANMLLQLREQIDGLYQLVQQGDEAARLQFKQQYFVENKAAISPETLKQGNYRFEQIGYLLADLTEPHTINVHIPNDKVGALRQVLQIFENYHINLSVIHSSRTPLGEVHFRISVLPDFEPLNLQKVIEEITTSGLGIILNNA